MPLLAAVVMLSNTQQSLADLNLLWVLVPGTLIKPLLIYLFHNSLFVVSLMSDVAIAAVLVALAVHTSSPSDGRGCLRRHRMALRAMTLAPARE